MLLAGTGAGQVRIFSSSSDLFFIHGLEKTLQTSTIAAQAASAKKDMAVVTAFRNVIILFFFLRLIDFFLTYILSLFDHLAQLSALQ